MSEVEQKPSTVMPVYKKWWFWVIIVVLVLIVAGAVGSSKNDGPHKIEDESSERGDAEDTEDEEHTFKVGDTIAIGNQEVIVKSVKRDYVSSNQYVKPGDGKEFVQITVEVKNTKDSEQSYNYVNWKLEDSNGALDTVNTAAYIADDDKLGYGELTAGGKKTGTLVFEVKQGETGLKLHYQLPSWGSKEAIIEL